MKRRHFLWLIPAGLVLASLVGLGVQDQIQRAHRQEVVVIQTQLERMGDLHTARQHLHHVREVKTAASAPEAWQFVPGAQTLARSLTENRALVSARTQLEAGVDLRAARVTQEGAEVVVRLPAARIYRPHVDLDLHRQSSGLLWRDDRLLLTAQREIEVAAATAGQASDLRAQAEAEAIEVVSALVRQATDRPVRVVISR